MKSDVGGDKEVILAQTAASIVEEQIYGANQMLKVYNKVKESVLDWPDHAMCW